MNGLVKSAKQKLEIALEDARQQWLQPNPSSGFVGDAVDDTMSLW